MNMQIVSNINVMRIDTMLQSLESQLEQAEQDSQQYQVEKYDNIAFQCAQLFP